MASAERIDAPKMISHVYFRGVDGMAIFPGATYVVMFLTIVAAVLRVTDVRILSWAVMGNHAHLVVVSGERTSISYFMQRVLAWYARWFNRRRKRRGPVLECRFHSSPIGDDAKLVEAIRYSLRNPVEAGLTTLRGLETHLRTAWPTILGRRKDDGVTDVPLVLSIFDTNPRNAVAKLAAWIADRDRPENERRRYEDFLGTIPGLATLPLRARVAPDAEKLRAIVARVCKTEAISKQELRGSSRSADAVRARESIVRRAVVAGFTQRQIATVLGVSASAVSRIRARLDARRNDEAKGTRNDLDLRASACGELLAAYRRGEGRPAGVGRERPRETTPPERRAVRSALRPLWAVGFATRRCVGVPAPAV